MLRLVVTCDDSRRTLPLPAEPATIGSDNDNDLVVACAGVSRKHATLSVRGETIVVQDLGSKNGLILRGRRVRHAELKPGEDVRIGRATLRLERISTADADRAISFVEASSTHSPAGGRTETDVPIDGATGALRWVREVEAAGESLGARRREFLRRARSIAQSDAIVLCHRLRGGDIAIDEIDGVMPVDDSLAPAVASIDKATHATVHGRWLIAPLGGGSVAAVHGDARTLRAPWCREFLEFVAAKLFDVGAAAEANVPASGDDLVFPPGFVRGESTAMRALFEQLRGGARSGAHVLIRGESGTGKELVARTIHLSGPTAARPFLAINCAAIPAELLEAELFGIRRRIATGVDPRPGLFLEANHGTVFLDEIGDLPLKLQPKLLRVLQEREVLSLGTSVPVKVDVRVIASTNRELEAMLADGSFREDLYYRIRALEFVVPPLRERRDDIAQLVTELVPRIAREHGKRIQGVSRKALAHLTAYDWPGNVRELENAIARAINRCPNRCALEAAHFDDPAAPAHPRPSASALRDRMQDAEAEAIAEALQRANGNKSEAARLLGITRPGLYAKLVRLKTKH